mmetsp:Transcript_10396/g.38343  ORF Transcript_10396/g.38343 Transcript_10396/m.38343 type:complete len:364 (+) Transcript_10396:354-1445(+)
MPAADVGGSLRKRHTTSPALQQPLIDEAYDEADEVIDTRRPQDRQPVVETSTTRLRRTQTDAEASAWNGVLARLLRGWRSVYHTLSASCARLYYKARGKGPPPLELNALQRARLEALRRRLGVAFDGDDPEHRRALAVLWRLAFPEDGDEEVPTGGASERWKDMGWQGVDPATDFRGGGFISLENLIFFGAHDPVEFLRLLRKTDGQRSDWEYPFAVAGLNITFELLLMLDLKANDASVPNTPPARSFLQLLDSERGDGDAVFESLYMMAFRILDEEWLKARASYMQFPEIMKRTKAEVMKRLLAKQVLLVPPRKECSLSAKLAELDALRTKLEAKQTAAAAMSKLSPRVTIATEPIPDLMDA